jgi:hypothetical protein
MIDLAIDKSDTEISLTLTSPQNTVAEVGIPKKDLAIKSIKVNGTVIYNNGSSVNGAVGVTFNRETSEYIIFDVLPGNWSFVAKNNAEITTAIGDNITVAKESVPYPNPSNTGVFYLPKVKKWQVYNTSGVKVLQGDGEKIDLSSFSQGIYTLKTIKSAYKLIYQ